MHETNQRSSFVRGARQRGFAMAFVFVLVALLLLIAILIITGAFNANNQAQAVGVKYGVLNSAEAAANLALNQLAENPSEAPGCVTGSMNNGVSYRSCLAYNNLLSGTGVMSTDYANGKPLWVPRHSGYIYGEATANGNRKAYVEAIAQPAPPLTLPPGAVNAAQNVNDVTAMPISQDPLHTNDADIHANNNITVGGTASKVQGSTFAVGTDALPGWNGVMNSGYSATGFPNATQIAEGAQTAKAIAQTGGSMTGAVFSATSTAYTGNIYINGDVNISSATVALGSGSDVYINGNLCISGTGSLVNNDGSQGILVVTGVVSSAGIGGYQVPLGNNTLLLVLANDPGSMNPCSVSSSDAVSLSPASGTESVGTIYAANGSVSIAGGGLLQGAFDAGNNVDLSGLAGSSLQYDAKQAQTTFATGTMTYTAYNQD